jgi:hypothetical protein
LTHSKEILSELELINKYVFQAYSIEIKNIEAELESQEYLAHILK